MAIVTNVGDASEFIENDVTGYLIKYPYFEFVDNALENAWENRTRWKDLGEAAGAKIRSIIKDDSIELFSRKIVSLLNLV